MNLLVVDDQVSVAEGIVNSIEWKKYGFNQVFCAYSAIEAKQFLTMHSIDIMLCDIEMPYENGLNLLEWINQRELPVRCIMLTAHAEFSYAQQALKLGSIDYILQPAAYEDIREAVLKAAEGIKRERILYSLSDIGKNICDNSIAIARALFFSILQGKSNDYGFLDSLGLIPEKNQPFWLVSFHVTSWGKEHWTEEELVFAIDNVCEELLAAYKQSYLVTLCNQDTCTAIVWSPEELISQLLLSRQMEFFISVCGQYGAFGLAIYIRKGEKRSQISHIWQELCSMREENVMLSSGIFLEKPNQSSEYRFIYKNRWLSQLKEGYGETTKYEAKKHIEGMAEAGILTKEVLKRFYSDFLQLSFLAAGAEIDLMEKVLISPQDFDLYYHGYESVESMEILIDRIIDALTDNKGNREASENVLHNAQRYIQEHIKDELHREDVAKSVHLNPDYLSKLFKKEVGLSLKEYILKQKMNHAQVLLKTTSLPIGIIASMVGYDNFSHFSQAYKKLTGERPIDTRGS
ncbi:MAG TPA: response regulator [Clostridiales bacterium]|nr:response regulator [Clostridiales bacterium]